MGIKIVRSRKNSNRCIHVLITGEDRWSISPWAFSRFLGDRIYKYLGPEEYTLTPHDNSAPVYLIIIEFINKEVTPDIIDFITSQAVAWKMMDREAKKKTL
jgi:hypothetical protein